MSLKDYLMNNLNRNRLSFESKAKALLGEALINKGLFHDSGLQSRGIPTFVAEWILDKFCPDGRMTSEIRTKINNFINSRLPRKEQKEEIKHRLSQGDQITLLDQFSVLVDLTHNERYLIIPSIDEKGAIAANLVDKHPNLLGGGMWGAGRLVYYPPPNSWSFGQLHMVDFKPLQVSKLDLDYYCQVRSEFTFSEWRELMVSSMGSNPDFYNPDQQMLLLARLIPLVQNNVNLVELAPKGTGKSFVFQNLSRYVRVVSGGKITAPQLFYNLASQTPGLLTQYDVVVFDEAQTISFNNPGEVVGILKDYLESGRYTRGHKDATASAGLVILANIPIDTGGKPRLTTLFHNLPKFLQETAFIDRLHGIIPGWDIPRVSKDTPARGMAFKADFFGEVLHRLRDRGGYDEYVTQHMRLEGSNDMRDLKAIQRMTAGFLRMLFPDINPSQDEFLEYCVQPSVAMRQRVREQLSRLDPEYKEVIIEGIVI
jgi:ATP-dependent Lon protease